jgi:hypothetical protein
MAKTDYQAQGACNVTSIGLFIRALGTDSVPWGNLHTFQAINERHRGRHRNGRGERSKVSESDKPNTSSGKTLRDEFGGL